MSMTDIGIQTFLVSLPVLMKNTALDGTGFAWTFSCTLGWEDAVVWAAGRTVRLLGVTVGAEGFTFT